jgi:hypothetical protein
MRALNGKVPASVKKGGDGLTLIDVPPGTTLPIPEDEGVRRRYVVDSRINGVADGMYDEFELIEVVSKC